MIKLESGKYLGSKKRQWSLQGVVISEIAYHAAVSENWHAHDNHHMSLVLQGGNREQRKGQESAICPGEMVFYESGELHRNFNTVHPSRNINLEIEPAFFFAYDLKTHVFNSSTLNRTDARFATLNIYKECQINGENAQTAVHALLLDLVTPKETANNDPRWVTMIRQLLHDRWTEHLSLQELAAAVNVHPVTVSKFFPRYFHCTLGAYTRKIKIEKAITLMHKPHISLTDIALQCGFFDQSHFIRTFKEVTGFLPTAYKHL